MYVFLRSLLNTNIQSSLPTKTKENSIRFLLFDNFFNKISIKRQKIYLSSLIIRSLNCCNIRITENSYDALFLQCFNCLTTRIIELPSLTNSNCTTWSISTSSGRYYEETCVLCDDEFQVSEDYLYRFYEKCICPDCVEFIQCLLE